MAWQDDMREIVRVLIDDIGTTPRNTDANLERVILVATLQVLQEVTFDSTYTVSIAQAKITPDPTLEATKNESLVNLACIKAACIIDRGSASKAAGKSYLIKDGNSTYDNRNTSTDKIKLLDKGWCAVYAEAKEEYEKKNSTTGIVAGRAVLTPFRLFAREYYSRI